MKLYKSFATVGGLTLLSRVFGFLRDILIAATLGSGWVADAFVVAFRFPNLFRRLFGEGAFNSAFVPIFAKKLEGEGRDAARGFAEDAMAGLLFILLIVTIVAELAMPFLMYGLAPGFDAVPEKFDLSVLLTRITMPYLLCMSIVALMSGALNSVGRFVESSSVSIVLNGVMMVATLFSLWLGYRAEPEAGVIQAWAVFVAGFLQLVVLIWGMRRSGLMLGFRRPRMTDDVRHLVRLGVPGVISGGVTQINIAIGTVIASLEPGAVSQLYYADRVYELPLAIVGIAVGIVLLPDVARQLRAGNTAAVMDSQNRSLEFALLLTIPAALALAVIPHRHHPRAVRARRIQAGGYGGDGRSARDVRAWRSGVRDDQGFLAGLLRARGHDDADALRSDQPDGEYDRLHRFVLPAARTRDDAAARHRHRNDARRLAQCVSAVVDAQQTQRFCRPMPGCGATCR